MSPTIDTSHAEMSPYVVAAVVGLLHHAETAVLIDALSVIDAVK